MLSSSGGCLFARFSKYNRSLRYYLQRGVEPVSNKRAFFHYFLDLPARRDKYQTASDKWQLQHLAESIPSSA
ncbi:hypothetical protein M0813_29058 [Anaeramoeba flamelloides]|uniref:Uncharacterized protein n=1 Tax=Anaeramoeba flamelloides TaxID=1746091 RepID=A0ABQ8XR32_9EUKA|nr:hypothetical protein M0813_29058 [Anaeramoeba flamelloides]